MQASVGYSGMEYVRQKREAPALKKVHTHPLRMAMAHLLWRVFESMAPVRGEAYSARKMKTTETREDLEAWNEEVHMSS